MRLLARSALAALAGVAAALAFEPTHWVLLLPLAVAAVTLLAARAPRLRAGFWIGFVFGTAFMLVLLPWLQVIGVYAWIPLAVIEGLFYGLAGLATVAVVRLPWWPVWAATAWVGVEALRAVVPFGGFPWGRLAFATEDTPVASVFAYAGAPGATFVVALLGTTLAWAVLRVPPYAGAGGARGRRGARSGRRGGGGPVGPDVGRRPGGHRRGRPGQRPGGGARGVRRAPGRARQPRRGDARARPSRWTPAPRSSPTW